MSAGPESKTAAWELELPAADSQNPPIKKETSMYIVQQPRPVPTANAYVAFVTGRRQVPASAAAVRVAPVGQVRR